MHFQMIQYNFLRGKKKWSIAICLIVESIEGQLTRSWNLMDFGKDMNEVDEAGRLRDVLQCPRQRVHARVLLADSHVHVFAAAPEASGNVYPAIKILHCLRLFLLNLPNSTIHSLLCMRNKTVRRWEMGDGSGSPFILRKLLILFGPYNSKPLNQRVQNGSYFD